MAKAAILLITLAAVSWLAAAKGSKKFLEDESHGSPLTNRAFQEDIMKAMDSMLGCGGQADAAKVDAIRKALTPMWHTLPKTHARIDRRTLRYFVHRYFMQSSSLLIRGFEPTRPVNDSYWGVADILSQVVPAYVESVLESRHTKQHGFGLEDSVSMVVMLEQLIVDSESTLLAKSYADKRKPMEGSLSHEGLKDVLQAYMVQWMFEGDAEDIAMLLANRSLMIEVVPHFEQLMEFAEGRMKALQYSHFQKLPKGRGQGTWAKKYTFEDAHEIVGGITRSFQSYWQSECDSMKGALVAMDELSTGRVPLAKFYNTAINKDWRFGESEAYLRELGALDESSSWASPQVIIPNYIQSTSNCIVSTPHYLVCCQNECESLLGEIEVVLGAPTAAPEDILQIVRNMTVQTTLDDEESPRLEPEGMLVLQLQQVATTHGGMVPLHGRLFAQWLHYVFPRECPFPHKIGMVSAVTPAQYGDEYIAKNADMKRHASNATASAINVTLGKDDLQWMSQWSPEEELIADLPRATGTSKNALIVVAVIFVSLIGVAGAMKSGKGSSEKDMIPSYSKSVFV